MTTLVFDFPDLPVEDEGIDWLRHAQVRELARVRANPRCGEQVVDAATDWLTPLRPWSSISSG